jgi:hypothetical protein
MTWCSPHPWPPNLNIMLCSKRRGLKQGCRGVVHHSHTMMIINHGAQKRGCCDTTAATQLADSWQQASKEQQLVGMKRCIGSQLFERGTDLRHGSGKHGKVSSIQVASLQRTLRIFVLGARQPMCKGLSDVRCFTTLASATRMSIRSPPGSRSNKKYRWCLS